MASDEHTYGPSCSLRVDSNPFTRRASELSELPPKLLAHFFYRSALPIDDPLSPLPTPTSSTSSTQSNAPPRPFSAYDNAALEEAWQDSSSSDKKTIRQESKFHGHGVFCHDDKETDNFRGRNPDLREIEKAPHPYSGVESLTKIVKQANEKATPGTSSDRSPMGGASNGKEKEGSATANIERNAVKPRKNDTSIEDPRQKEKSKLSNPETASRSPTSTCAEAAKSGDSQLLLSDDPDSIAIDHAVTFGIGAFDNGELDSELPQKKHRFSLHRKDKDIDAKYQEDKISSQDSPRNKAPPPDVQYGSSLSDTTGTPFLRAPIRSRRSLSPRKDTTSSQEDVSNTASDVEANRVSPSRPKYMKFGSQRSGSQKSASDTSHRGHLFPRKEKKAFVPVGISRLHLVEMPDLEVCSIDYFLRQSCSHLVDEADILESSPRRLLCCARYLVL